MRRLWAANHRCRVTGEPSWNQVIAATASTASPVKVIASCHGPSSVLDASFAGPLRLSPDGQQVAADVWTPDSGSRDLWVFSQDGTQKRRLSYPPAQHLRPVGELRNHVGTNEARHLEPRRPGAREHLHKPHLVVGGDHLRLVLEAVPGTDLADLHVLALRSGHGQIMPIPPLTPRVCPVMYDASSDARNAITAATSSGCPSRLRTVLAIMF